MPCSSSANEEADKDILAEESPPGLAEDTMQGVDSNPPVADTGDPQGVGPYQLGIVKVLLRVLHKVLEGTFLLPLLLPLRKVRGRDRGFA